MDGGHRDGWERVTAFPHYFSLSSKKLRSSPSSKDEEREDGTKFQKRFEAMKLHLGWQESKNLQGGMMGFLGNIKEYITFMIMIL